MSLAQRRMLVPWLGFTLALGLHLWQLGTPARMVGDEISFVRDAEQYLLHRPYFDPHPPLGKELIGSAIGLFGDTPFVWRLSNAVLGALLVPLVWWIVWRLTKRERAAGIAALLLLFDGLTLVDSRLGLINMPLIVFGVAVVAAVLKALEQRDARWWILVAGTCIGLSISTKWIGVLASIPALLLWWRPAWFGLNRASGDRPNQFAWGIGWLMMWPLALYCLVFSIHFAWLHVPATFWSTNVEMLNYHLSVPASGDPHAQPWWGWLLAWRPFLYSVETSPQGTAIIAALPNPWLWWSGALVFLWSLWRGWRTPTLRLFNALLLIVWLPFALIQRVMYSYHMLFFDVWLLMLLGYWLDRIWTQRRWLAISYLLIAGLVWWWFTPLYFHQPLSDVSLQWRWWLPSWNLRL